MFALFRHKPVFRDDTFRDFAEMLTDDDGSPTYRGELLHPELLDYSLDSLRHLDNYLDAIYIDLPPDENLYRVVLRAGSYAGEVIRRQSSLTEFHWTTFRDAAPLSSQLKKQGMHLGTVGVLWASRDVVCLPLGRVCRYIANGPEESLFGFASALLSAELRAFWPVGTLGPHKV